MILRLIWFTHRANPSGKRDCGVVVAAIDVVVTQPAYDLVVASKDGVGGAVVTHGAVAVNDVVAPLASTLS